MSMDTDIWANTELDPKASTAIMGSKHEARKVLGENGHASTRQEKQLGRYGVFTPLLSREL